MENLSKKSKEFIEWIEQLKNVTADKTDCEPREVKINEEAAFEYFNSGFTPSQCFREEWANDGN